MDNLENISIVGGGIGGLTLAIALRQAGKHVTVYEQSEKLLPVGAGIVLGNNAMQVFTELGLTASLRAAGQPIHELWVTDDQLRPLSVTDLEKWEKRFGQSSLAIHRGDLQRVLLDALPSDTVQLGKELSHLRRGADIYLNFVDGTEGKTDFLVGADGINSVVRQQLFPRRKKRSARQVCWRGVANVGLLAAFRRRLTEAWGPQGRFGIVPLPNDRVYWFAVLGYRDDPMEVKGAELAKVFANFAAPVGDLVAATPLEQVHVAELEDLQPPGSWFMDENIVLLGDAAHATTPNLGQGAGQAIEDARVLAHCLLAGKGLEAYQNIRQRKVWRIVKTSWRVGQAADWSSPLAQRIRNQVLRWTPNRVNQGQLEQVFTLDPL
ncbi:MAG: FAD-dependent monooxygenase [Bacteroidota bacterium]